MIGFIGLLAGCRTAAMPFPCNAEPRSLCEAVRFGVEPVRLPTAFGVLLLTVSAARGVPPLLSDILRRPLALTLSRAGTGLKTKLLRPAVEADESARRGARLVLSPAVVPAGTDERRCSAMFAAATGFAILASFTCISIGADGGGTAAGEGGRTCFRCTTLVGCSALLRVCDGVCAGAAGFFICFVTGCGGGGSGVARGSVAGGAARGELRSAGLGST